MAIESVGRFHVLRFSDSERSLAFCVAFFRLLRNERGLERLTEEPRVVLLASPLIGRKERSITLYASGAALALVLEHDLPCDVGEAVRAADLPTGCAPIVGWIGDAEQGNGE